MKFRGNAAKFVALIGAVLTCLVLAAPSTSARSSKPPVFWIDLMGTARQHPGAIFFTANSGSRVLHLKWTGWGKNRTVGRGRYSVSGASIPGHPYPKGPARIVAWKPMRCVPEFGNREGKTILVYRHARLNRPGDNGGRKWVDISAYTGRSVCK